MLNIVHAEPGHNELDGEIHVLIDTTEISLRLSTKDRI